MAVFTRVEPRDLEPWLAALNLGPVRALIGIEGGIENTNYFLEADNPQNERFVLTVFERLNAEQVPFYLALMRHLAQKGLPVPAPRVVQAAPDMGSDPDQLQPTLAFHLHGKPACVVSRLRGAPQLSPTAAHTAQVGDMLAQLHLAVEDFPLMQPNLRGLDWWRDTVPVVLPHVQASQRSLLQLALEEQLTFAQGAKGAALPVGAVHADLFRDNAMFEGEQLCGVFDFYFAGVDRFTFDLAVTLNDWCAERDGTGQATGPLNPHLVMPLLRAYGARRPLSGLEIETLPVLLRAAALRFWLSRLWDWYLPRAAHMLTPHDPAPMERILRHHQQNPLSTDWLRATQPSHAAER